MLSLTLMYSVLYLYNIIEHYH